MLSKIACGAPKVYKSSASSTILTCLTRMKDVKPIIKNACAECLDASYSATVGSLFLFSVVMLSVVMLLCCLLICCNLFALQTFADVLEPIKAGLSITAPGSKIQACEFFTRIMLKVDFPTAKKSSATTKEIVDQMCKVV